MEYVHAISLPAKAGMLEIIRKIYENIELMTGFKAADVYSDYANRSFYFNLLFRVKPKSLFKL